MSFECIYCRRPRDDESVQHIIPVALGGRISVKGVCRACNNLLGTRVESRLVEFDILRMARNQAESMAGRHDDYDFGVSELKQHPGVNAHVVFTKDGPDMRVWGKNVSDDHVELTMDARAFLKTDVNTVRERYLRRGIKRVSFRVLCGSATPDKNEAELVRTKMRQTHLAEGTRCEFSVEQFKPELSATIELNLLSIQPAVIKIAYEYAILKLGPAFASTAAAGHMRSFILEENARRRETIPVMGRIFPYSADAHHETMERVMAGRHDLHVLTLWQGVASVYLYGTLYGTVRALPSDEEVPAAFREGINPGFATTIDVTSRAVSDGSFDDYLMARLRELNPDDELPRTSPLGETGTAD